MTSISKTITDASDKVKETMKSAIDMGMTNIRGSKDIGNLYYTGKPYFFFWGNVRLSELVKLLVKISLIISS